jgi:hypothetical protein
LSTLERMSVPVRALLHSRGGTARRSVTTGGDTL